MKNAINWFEIPVTDYQRAKTFYQTILNVEITDMPMPEEMLSMVFFHMTWKTKVLVGQL